MSSRCRSAAVGAGMLALLAVGACTQGAGGSERPVRGRSMPAAESTDRAAGVYPGIHPAVVLGELRNPTPATGPPSQPARCCSTR